MIKKQINLPLNQQEINKLNAGDFVYLNGEIYCFRDKAHKLLINLIDNNQKLPIELKNKTIFYAGPAKTPDNEIIGVIGPTTSARMDIFANKLYDLGIQATIGKGERSKDIIENIKKNQAIYFAAIGGISILYKQTVTSCKVIAYPELQTEAIRVLKIKNFPVIVAIDSKGKTIF